MKHLVCIHDGGYERHHLIDLTVTTSVLQIIRAMSGWRVEASQSPLGSEERSVSGHCFQAIYRLLIAVSPRCKTVPQILVTEKRDFELNLRCTYSISRSQMFPVVSPYS